MRNEKWRFLKSSISCDKTAYTYILINFITILGGGKLWGPFHITKRGKKRNIKFLYFIVLTKCCEICLIFSLPIAQVDKNYYSHYIWHINWNIILLLIPLPKEWWHHQWHNHNNDKIYRHLKVTTTVKSWKSVCLHKQNAICIFSLICNKSVQWLTCIFYSWPCNLT